MGLQDCAESFDFYQNLTECISAMGLCIFSVGASVAEISAEMPAEHESSDRIPMYPARLFHWVTGSRLTAEKLLSIGKQSRRLQDQLQHSFQKQHTAKN